MVLFFKKEPLAALAVIALVLALVWPTRRVQPLALFDQQFYLGIAQDLRDHGRFTDGYQFAGPGVHPSGMRFAPLYPAVLAGAAAVDPAFAAAMRCVVSSEGHDAGCSRAAPVVRTVQVGLLGVVYWLTWWMADAVGGAAVGWVALGLALLTAPAMLDTADWLMTETLALALTTGATAAAVGRRYAVAGALLGLAILCKPGFLYLGLACLVVGGGVALRRRDGRAWGGFALCLVAVIAPWLARNLVVMHRLALTHGYDSHTLVQRISFDAMTWREYGLSYVCWLPDGNALGRSLAGAAACDRFGWSDRADTFYAIGIGPMLQQTLLAAGGYEHHLGYLLRTYIWPHALWHVATSVPLALRGAWIDRYWGVVLAPVCLWQTLRRPALRVIALPGWFMLAFNAAVAVNQPRYNLMLVPAYAIAGAMVSKASITLLRETAPVAPRARAGLDTA